MDNNYFFFFRKNTELDFEKIHICSWEFKHNSAVIEFGGEIINPLRANEDEITVTIYVPWILKSHRLIDLYESLKDPENCKFIFNDSLTGSTFLDGGKNKEGTIQNFTGRSPLCILPIKSEINQDNKIVILKFDLRQLKKTSGENPINIYFRFYIDVNPNMLSTRKKGISKSSIIYDLKVNEKRNLPNNSGLDFQQLRFPKITTCYFLSILPNTYELTYFENNSLKNIRTLEHESFKKYLGDDRVKADEYLVVFHKKKDQESYGFFSVYTKERIGTGQFALAILVNMLSGILLFLPSFRIGKSQNFFSLPFWISLPCEVYISLLIGITIVLYFVWPGISQFFIKLRNMIMGYR